MKTLNAEFLFLLLLALFLVACSRQSTYNKFIRNAGDGNLRIVTTLFERGHVEDVDVRNTVGNTALMMAAKNGHFEIAQYLLSKGADPLLANLSSENALTLARREGRTQITLLLAREKSTKEGP